MLYLAPIVLTTRGTVLPRPGSASIVSAASTAQHIRQIARGLDRILNSDRLLPLIGALLLSSPLLLAEPVKSANDGDPCYAP